MDIQALKLELVQQLVATDDATVPTKPLSTAIRT